MPKHILALYDRWRRGLANLVPVAAPSTHLVRSATYDPTRWTEVYLHLASVDGVLTEVDSLPLWVFQNGAGARGEAEADVLVLVGVLGHHWHAVRAGLHGI